MGSFGTVGVEEILRLSSQSTMDEGKPEGRTVSLSQRQAINREENYEAKSAAMVLIRSGFFVRSVLSIWLYQINHNKNAKRFVAFGSRISVI